MTCASETWILLNNDENALPRFERKILTKIYGAVHENGVWRVQKNKELESKMEGENIIKYIKSMTIA